MYVDSTGQQFKEKDHIKIGFESIFIWITQNKTTEWINYIINKDILIIQMML